MNLSNKKHMKKITTIIAILTFAINIIEASNDSLPIKNDSILEINYIENNNELNVNTINKEKNINQSKKKSIKIKKIRKTQFNNNPEGFGDFLNDLWDIISSPFKPVWGKYEEDNMRSEGPYFLFNRSSGNASDVQKEMKTIRDRIRVENSKEREIYSKILEVAGTTTINNCSSGEALCESATRAKASAFVYLVGLDANGILLDTPDTHGTIRRGYRDRALDYLRDVDAAGLHNAYDGFSFIPGPLGSLSSLAGALAEWEKQVLRAKELQMLCQAWDMLRWCYNIDANLPNDGLIRSRLEEAGQQIIDRYVTPLHRRAQNGVYRFAHNNYNLIVGASIASAAICFHDFSTYFFLGDKKPDRWANSAYYNIHKVMWNDGWIYGKKKSKAGDMYGYSEGPHYFEYAFENMVPMFLARFNFDPTNNTNAYNSFSFDPFPYNVKNYWYDADYHNIYKWYNNLIQSDNYHPTIDDSYAGKQFNTSMAILRRTQFGQYNFTDDIDQLKFIDFSLREDYLAAHTPPIKNNLPKSILMESGIFTLPGHIIVGNEAQMKILMD
jgi:hypothetical protein